MLRKIRITLASIVFILCAALFLDGSGTVSSWFGWVARIQFLPALLALNLAVVIVLIVLTLIFGRAYCSVICPLGIMQDGISHISSMRKGKKARFRWSPEVKWLRYSVLALFIIALVAGLTSVSALLAPYSAFGRIATSLVRPVLPTAIIAGVTLLVVGVLAWIGGRTYCNTLCPVGTVLSFFSRFSLLRPVIDADKCRNCRACEHKCKASCINIDNHEIDYSRCVDCFNCLDSCRFGALHYRMARGGKACGASGTVQDNAEVSTEEGKHNAGRRAFISSSVIAATAIALEAQEKKVDGGYAAVTAKKAPERTNPIVPFGAVSLRHFHQHCTSRAYFGAFRAFRAAPAVLVGHFRQHQPVERCGRTQNVIRTLGYAELASGAMLVEMPEAHGSERHDRIGPLRSLLGRDCSISAIHLLLLGLEGDCGCGDH